MFLEIQTQDFSHFIHLSNDDVEKEFCYVMSFMKRHPEQEIVLVRIVNKKLGNW